ncbi:FecCD family ABC transporter permease, partial [Kitasatospora sp. NPDC058965]|uniref:FecCD family ABC transporter permease n=1 Tax=Kitasatospora sp. NPDC058965 TaxID=3346682 RepID=UPI0036A322A8
MLFGLGLGVLLLCLTLSLALGSRSIPLATVLDALTGHRTTGPDARVVTGLRLPRTVLGLVVGAALAVAGAVAQGATRNPLAAPTTLGVNAGASFAVVTAIYALHLTRPVEYLWFAVAGAALAGLAAQLMARRAGELDPTRLALGGTVLAAVLTSWTSAVMLASRRTLDEARFWLAGSLEARGFEVLLPVLPLIGTGLLLAFAVAPALNALSLGDRSARSLGVPVSRIRAAAGLSVVLLAAGAVAAAGPIAFVGLAAPHLVRLLLGRDHRLLLPGCLVVGPVL